MKITDISVTFTEDYNLAVISVIFSPLVTLTEYEYNNLIHNPQFGRK